METGVAVFRLPAVVGLLAVLALGCLEVTGPYAFDPSQSRELTAEANEPLVQVSDELAAGYRFLHGEPPQDRISSFLPDDVPTLRRVVPVEQLPVGAIPVGGHVYFSPLLSTRVRDFAAYYFEPLSPWSTIPAAQADHLLGEVQLREDLRLDLDRGCWARAMLIGSTIHALGFHSKKIWIARNAAGLGPEGWGWHCANIIVVEQADGSISPAVLDPAFDARLPLTVEAWFSRLNGAGVPVLVREPWLYGDAPPRANLNYWSESNIALPEVDHIDVSLSEWTRYSINSCLPSEPCMEGKTVQEKLEQARRDLAGP